jgi:hypothetical protein
MPTPKSKAEEYRREAAGCLQLAERMSDSADRARLLEMAQDWLDLAVKAERQSIDKHKD